ncbi:MAG TPA: hypothetical protein VGK74_09985 [Symbiobacteriaceae bacterium]|jgi:hypothetical protein
MAEEELNLIPGRNEPDPDNIRFRSFQGGTDGLPDGVAEADESTYAMMKFDGDGRRSPIEGLETVQGASAGLSGLPQADAGTTPAQFNDPDAPRNIGGGERPRTGP